MKHFAFNKVYKPDTPVALLQIVHLDDEGNYLTHKTLEREIAQVSWLGGICILLPPELIPRPGQSIDQLLQHARNHTTTHPLRAWHAYDLSATTPTDRPVMFWKPVV